MAAEVVVLYDGALETDRRRAWARYFKAREDAQQIAWWAAEIGEWLTQTADQVAPEVQELIDIITSSLPIGAKDVIRRYVKQRIEAFD